MRREASTPEVYKYRIIAVDTSNRTLTNNASVLTGIKWINFNYRYCIATGIIIPKYQHQNYCEHIGGKLKHTALKIFRNKPYAPLHIGAIDLVLLIRIYLINR